MRNRPIVVLVCIYIVGLIWVLVWQPEVGERLFGWKEKENHHMEVSTTGHVSCSCAAPTW